MPLSPDLHLVLDSISDGVYVTDDDRRILLWSAGAERITGYSAEDVVGHHCYDNILVHTDLNGRNLCVTGCPLAACIASGERVAVNEVFLKRKDGERLAAYVKTDTFTEGGCTYGVETFGELESVAGRELVERVQELSNDSLTDPLSALFNRRYFGAALEQHFEMMRRMGTRYGILHVDVDDFKRINDTLGHAAGDEAIRFISSVLSRNARKMDVTARYGGDEFVIVCAVATCAALEAHARRLITIVRESHFGLAEDAGLQLQVSVGGALADPQDHDAYQAVSRADEAMYRAKRAGKGRYEIDRSVEGGPVAVAG